MSEAYKEIYEPPEKQEPVRVPWALKLWKDFTDEDKKGLAEHIPRLRERKGEQRARDYCKYLHKFCGAPSDLYMRIAGER